MIMEPQPLQAKLSVAAPETAATEFMYMPGGIREIAATNYLNGQPIKSKVEVTRASAAALQQQLGAVAARNAPHKPYFDVNHEDAEASFWPEEFSWREQPQPGIYVRGQWSDTGRALVEGKSYRAFSPVFFVDDPARSPAKVICNPGAPLNFGGLVNDPAFKNISPLWAKNAAGAHSSDNQKPKDTQMSPEEIAALQAKNKELEQQIDALAAKDKTDALVAAQLKAAQSEMDANTSKLESVALKAKVVNFENADKALRAKNAEAAVADAVKRGAIPPKDTALAGKWQGWCEQTPEMIDALGKLPGSAALEQQGITKGATAGLQAKEGALNVLKAYSGLVAKNTQVKGLNTKAFEERGDYARQMAMIYARDISKNLDEMLGVPLAAAADADTLGTLAGTLVAQRTLELFKYTFPMLSRVYNDYSDVPANFNQTINTRIITVPAVQTYSTTLGADGRPAGWSTAATATTTDVNVTLDEHVGVPIVFDSNVLASTVRRLFDEMAPAANYALGKYFVDKIYAKITAANFNGYAVGGTAKVPDAYATYPVGLNDFSRSHLATLSGILSQNEVPEHDRSALLSTKYFTQLQKDPSLVTFFAGQQAPQIITDGILPQMAGFTPIKAPNLPTTNNLTGFVFQKSALIAVTRLSNDYSQALPGASYGSVTTVTNPDTGISVVLVQYVNHTAGYAEWRIQVMLGAAVGDKRGGLVITSQ
jgi:Mu-like prophage I protein